MQKCLNKSLRCKWSGFAWILVKLTVAHSIFKMKMIFSWMKFDKNFGASGPVGKLLHVYWLNIRLFSSAPTLLLSLQRTFSILSSFIILYQCKTPELRWVMKLLKFNLDCLGMWKFIIVDILSQLVNTYLGFVDVERVWCERVGYKLQK